MAEMFHLDIVTPEKSILSCNVQEIVAPGTSGEFGVLSGHTPFLTILKIGHLWAKTQEGNIHMAVSGGFAEITGDKVIILAETAERAEDINVEETKAMLEMAYDKLKSIPKEDPDFKKWDKKVRIAEVKLSVAEKAKTV